MRNGNGEPRRLPEAAALAIVAALAFGACSSSPENEEVAAIYAILLDEQGDGNISPSSVNGLENVDFSHDDAAKSTGLTLKQAIKLAKNPGDYTTALAEYHRHAFKSFIKPGKEDFEYRDTDREMLYEILTGNIEYTQEIITNLRISTKELLAAIEKFSKPNQLKKQMSIASGLLDGPVDLPTDYDYDPTTPNLNPVEKASTLRLTNEAQNRALTFHALIEIGNLAKTSKVTMFDEEVCDIDYENMAETAGGNLFEFTKELGWVSIAQDDESEPNYGWLPLTLEPDLLARRPVSEPLPGVEGDEKTCTDDLQETSDLMGAIISATEDGIPDSSSGKSATTKLSGSLNKTTKIDLSKIPYFSGTNYEGF